LSCTEVTGLISAVDAAGPAPCSTAQPVPLHSAINDMHTAYLDAAGRAPDVSELGGGSIGGLTIPPGVYSWSSAVDISTDVTLSGGPNDVWIFQVAQNVDIANGKAVMLIGGAQARNIYWQVAGQVTIGTTASFQGNVLSKTLIAMNTGASITGRLFAQSAVTLQMNAVTVPAN
jgi:hypothetical protein